MSDFAFNKEKCIKKYNSLNGGLTKKQVEENKIKYGVNVLSEKKGKSLFKKIFEALLDPMIIILEFALIITLGVNIGKELKGGQGDFLECLGIIFSILISVVLTLIMEGKSQKAFKILNNLSDKSAVKVKRDGEVLLLPKEEVVVGDRVLISSGDKICADGRLLESLKLQTDESMLTGESNSVIKNSEKVLEKTTPLAERVNMVYSGTVIVSGSGEMLVTSVGDNTEMGKIAGELQIKNCVSAPLQAKLNKLGRVISFIGILVAVFVFILSATKLAISHNLKYENITQIFIEAIVLIVAAVPEGLPATVAISLTLNVLKLSKSNALIKKMVATETVGCVSVICSDKTGTLTQNKMSVVKEYLFKNGDIGRLFYTNMQYNLQVEKVKTDQKEVVVGSATERAIYLYCQDKDYFKDVKILSVEPFSSETKFMSSTIVGDFGTLEFLKGAPEKIIEKCSLNKEEKLSVLQEMAKEQKLGRRCLAFAHKSPTQESFVFEGFVSIFDPIRPEVKQAVLECKNAGIRVKILTGDNLITANAVARELGLDSGAIVVNATEIEKLSDAELKKQLPKITVIARSTPLVKLRVVKLLKELGEVVAVTGDGINDAPAMKHADIGIAMGSGSQVTKEAGDIILLDDSFSTIVKAISFGRSIYRNFQRFLTFQLTVNFAAVGLITVCSLLGLDNPFTSLQLLWLNLIMDGPPALSLALEGVKKEYMSYPPVKRNVGIINKKLIIKISLNAIMIGTLVFLQYQYNFLKVDVLKVKTSAFCLFTFLQIFNSFNCKELGVNSIFKGLFSNKLMVISMGFALGLQVVLTEFVGGFMGVPLGFVAWLKIIGVSLSIILFSEGYKLVVRLLRGNIQKLQKNPTNEKLEVCAK